MEKVKLISPQSLNLSYLQSPPPFCLALEAGPASKTKTLPFSSTVKKLSRKISSLKLVCLGNPALKLLKPRAAAPSHGIWVTSTSEGAEAHGGSLCSAKRSPGPQQPRVHVQTAGGRGGSRHSSPPRPALRPAEPGPWRRAPITPVNRGGVPGGHTLVQGLAAPPLTGTCACTVRTQAVIVHFSLVFDKDSITTSARPGGGGRRRSGRGETGNSPPTAKRRLRVRRVARPPRGGACRPCPPGLRYIKAFFVNRGSRELQGAPQG